MTPHQHKIVVRFLGLYTVTVRVAEVQFRTDGSDRTARTELSVQVQFWFWFGRQPAVQVRSSGFEKFLRTGFEPVRTELNLYFSNPGHTCTPSRGLAGRSTHSNSARNQPKRRQTHRLGLK